MNEKTLLKKIEYGELPVGIKVSIDDCRCRCKTCRFLQSVKALEPHYHYIVGKKYSANGRWCIA